MHTPDPFAARCRDLAAAPYYAAHAHVFLDDAAAIEAGAIAGPIGLQHALTEAGVDPEDTHAEIMAATEWLVSGDPGGLDPAYLPPGEGA